MLEKMKAQDKAKVKAFHSKKKALFRTFF